MDEIYLDNAATTKPLPEVVNKIKKVLEDNYANPSSLHKLGINAEKLVKEARLQISNKLKTTREEIIFTGSGTLANNIGIKGAAYRLKKFGNNIITTEIEHKSVLQIFKHLEKRGFEVDYIPVNKKGIINLDILKEKLSNNTILISTMAVNNEVGSIQPIKRISEIVNKYKNLYFHVDGVQALGKINLNIKELGIDLYTVSGHKIHGPKGIGALYINNDIFIDKILHGSGQEKGFYPGTENTPGIAGFGEAVKHLPNNKSISKLKNLKNLLKQKIQTEIPDVIINTPPGDKSAPHILNVSFAKIKGEVLVHSLESENIYISTGSACTSRKNKTSHIIKALGLPDNYREGTVRFSLSQFNTEKEIEFTIKTLKKHVERLRKIMGGNR
ncbi:MAG: cysteine desulfurase [Halanaerobiales bacterium]|nr:cysteine desulfurase [Halanaerobiales bacterium]